VAYVSNESGVGEVYVRAFPEPTGQLRVSEGGGTDPVWAPNGSAVYYLVGGEVWRADLSDGGVSQRSMLFTGSWATVPQGAPVTNWDVHPDGESFVFVRSSSSGTGEQISGVPVLEVEIVANWFEEMAQRLGN